jgi:hypothetical protein
MSVAAGERVACGLTKGHAAMPANKDFKRLVRGRMQKTGESYTTARAQLRKHKPAVASSAPSPAEYAKLAGKSDAVLKEKTSRNWERWVKALDRAKAYTWPAARCGPKNPKCHPRKVDADYLAGQDLGRRMVHRQRSREESGRAHPREAAGAGGGDSGEAGSVWVLI